jgi:hypothetical protein
MIEFIDGENWCRWNGTLMSPEKCIELFGIDGEIYSNEDETILEYDSTIYTDKPISEVILLLGEVHKADEPVDPILTQGYVNYSYEALDQKLDGKVILSMEDIKLLDNIKPLKEFKNDYPNFNKELYEKFYNELDEYFEDIRNE